MKLFHKFFLALLVCASMVLYSCNSRGGSYYDDDDGGHIFAPTDTLAPQLTINTPAASQVFSSGNTVNISGRLTDDYGLYRGTIKMSNDANGQLYVNQPYEIHGLLLYNFSLNHNVVVGTPTDFTITISFEDHGLNTVTKSVKIKVNP